MARTKKPLAETQVNNFDAINHAVNVEVNKHIGLTHVLESQSRVNKSLIFLRYAGGGALFILAIGLFIWLVFFNRPAPFVSEGVAQTRIDCSAQQADEENSHSPEAATPKPQPQLVSQAPIELALEQAKAKLQQLQDENDQLSQNLAESEIRQKITERENQNLAEELETQKELLQAYQSSPLDRLQVLQEMSKTKENPSGLTREFTITDSADLGARRFVHTSRVYSPNELKNAKRQYCYLLESPLDESADTRTMLADWTPETGIKMETKDRELIDIYQKYCRIIE
jgi:ribosome assembly protein YihI (activator of Der GTPase)